MPHVGGGGHVSGGGGGFHSFGGGSSSETTPRYDKHGNLHSSYYIRPGYYYHHHYIPYTYDGRRGIQNFAASILLFITAIVLIVFAVHNCLLKGKYNQEKLEDYGLEKYAEIYNEDSEYYEKNVLVTFVCYEDNSTYDYVCINGDKVNSYVDDAFGGDKSHFGHALIQNVRNANYQENIYTYLSQSLNEVLKEKLSYSPEVISFLGIDTNNVKNSQIINFTPYKITNGYNQLKESMNNFYNETKFNISFVIDTNDHVYSIDWKLFTLLSVGALFSVTIGIILIFKKRRMIQFIEQEIANGNGKQYFEGEYTYEEYESGTFEESIENKDLNEY